MTVIRDLTPPPDLTMSCAPSCALGQPCQSAGDCQSGICTGGVCAQLNGCDLTNATDQRGMAAVTVTFPNGNFTYAPRCLLVSAGTMVTFNGPFMFHPLLAGVVQAGQMIPQPSGTPLPTTPLNTGTTATFTMSSAGNDPYYCNFHGASLNMNGAILVR
jgi:plastocyanin